ncbi:hypothetical protein BKA93DRAFT_694648, partial [Sparassis latifolia]
TRHRLGKIPLVIGMRVMISQNFDVNGGIVNGSIGILRKIRYTIDEFQQRHLVSCIVEVSDSDAQNLPYLPSHYIPVLNDTISM